MGNASAIELGGQYLVHGKYILPPGERGKLYFYETAEGAWGKTPTAEMDLQYTTLDKEAGEFTLLHGMADRDTSIYISRPRRATRGISPTSISAQATMC